MQRGEGRWAVGASLLAQMGFRGSAGVAARVFVAARPSADQDEEVTWRKRARIERLLERKMMTPVGFEGIVPVGWRVSAGTWGWTSFRFYGLGVIKLP